jgi:hypothetical protein
MKNKTKIAHAVLIQPRNGQHLAMIAGIEIDSRDWTPADAKRFPQATRQLWDGGKLVVDRATNEVYAIQS